MLLESMRASRNSPHVALVSYNTIRSKNPNKIIFVFEGFEDLPYYETIYNRINREGSFSPLIAKGKDQVLGLRALLEKREEKDKMIRYFVDKDFDHLKEHPAGEDVYLTEGYSIENSLVSKEILQSLLLSEFKCCADAEYEAIGKIEELYEKTLEQFFDEMRLANQAIFHARTNKIALKNIEDKITEYVQISLGEVSGKPNDPYQLIGWPDDLGREILSSKELFDKLSPHMDWRGKFIYSFFIRFLKLIKDDRTSDAPTYFTKKSGVKYDPNGDVMRTLASLSVIPESLATFIRCNHQADQSTGFHTSSTTHGHSTQPDAQVSTD